MSKTKKSFLEELKFGVNLDKDTVVEQLAKAYSLTVEELLNKLPGVKKSGSGKLRLRRPYKTLPDVQIFDENGEMIQEIPSDSGPFPYQFLFSKK